MRLLLRSNTGEFSLTKEFVGDDIIPPYAILSHIWSEEEVTFKDLIDGTGQDKAGYKKIWFCGQQAERDGLQYFWADTCCIDKYNQVVLQGAVPGSKPAQDAFAQFLGQQPRKCEQDEYDQKAAAAAAGAGIANTNTGASGSADAAKTAVVGQNGVAPAPSVTAYDTTWYTDVPPLPYDSEEDL